MNLYHYVTVDSYVSSANRVFIPSVALYGSKEEARLAFETYSETHIQYGFSFSHELVGFIKVDFEMDKNFEPVSSPYRGPVWDKDLK